MVRCSPSEPAPGAQQLAVARASVAWLAAANTVGLLLATLLLAPGLNDALAPLTYGRWAPVHLDAQLYGWCALPLVGLLLRACVPASSDGARHTRWVLAAWSAALLVGCVSWLGGGSGGKLFLDWSGPARVVFPLALSLLWSVLAYHVLRRWRAEAVAGGRGGNVARAALVCALLLVPTGLYFSADPRTYPPVNPHSGGATGTSLFGSTLALVAIFVALPWLARLPLRDGARRSRLGWWSLAAGGVGFALLDHGNASHHAGGQIAGLATLFLAPWFVARGWARHVWAEGSRRWLWATALWGVLLVLDGWLTFLPGLSERLKFTNALVAHSHLAMAGFVTSLHVALLLNLGDSAAVRAVLAAPRAFRWWQAGAAVQVAVLLGYGWIEGAEPWTAFGEPALRHAVYGTRWLGGAAMTGASFLWLIHLLRGSNAPKSSTA